MITTIVLVNIHYLVYIEQKEKEENVPVMRTPRMYALNNVFYTLYSSVSYSHYVVCYTASIYVTAEK